MFEKQSWANADLHIACRKPEEQGKGIRVANTPELGREGQGLNHLGSRKRRKAANVQAGCHRTDRSSSWVICSYLLFSLPLNTGPGGF